MSLRPPSRNGWTGGGSRKIVLALDSGGGRGAFQVGVEETLRERYGLKFDGIVGVSAGALNGVLIAAGRHDILYDLWANMRRRDVYAGGFNPWSVLHFALGTRRSIATNWPLERKVRMLLPGLKFLTPFRVVWVDLASGRTRISAPGEAQFAEALMASAGMPVVWEPVTMPALKSVGVDGGLGGLGAIGAAISHFDADQLILVTCRPSRLRRQEEFPHGFEVARRSLEVVLHKLWLRDIEETQRINRLLTQTRDVLRSATGRPYKHVQITTISPSMPLGKALDFSARLNAVRIEHGRERAREVMETVLRTPPEAPGREPLVPPDRAA